MRVLSRWRGRDGTFLAEHDRDLHWTDLSRERVKLVGERHAQRRGPRRDLHELSSVRDITNTAAVPERRRSGLPSGIACDSGTPYTGNEDAQDRAQARRSPAPVFPCLLSYIW